MLDGLVDWLKKLAVFIVVCETILAFTPSAAYKRYIKPFVGLIILLRITSFLFGAVEVDWSRRVDEIFTSYEESVSQYLENVPIVEAEDDVENGPEEGLFEYDSGQDKKLNEELINIDDIIISPIQIGETE